MQSEFYDNLYFGMKFVEKYQKWHDEELEKNSNRTYPRIKPMFNDMREVNGFMFSFQHPLFSTARPTILSQNYENFLADFKQNFYDHWHIQRKYADK